MREMYVNLTWNNHKDVKWRRSPASLSDFKLFLTKFVVTAKKAINEVNKEL